MKAPVARWHHGLILAQALGLVLLGLSYVRIFGDATQSMLFSSQEFLVMFDGPVWGTTLGNNLVFFVLAVLLLHLLYGTVCWILGHLSARAWPTDGATIRQHVLLWFVLVTVGLLANNSAEFVASSLGEPYAAQMSRSVFATTLGRSIWICVLVAATITTIVAGWRWWRAGGRVTRQSYVAVGALAVAYVAVSAHSILPTPAPISSNKPNVILIGLDSLRADLLDPQLSPGVTPHIATFIKAGTKFSNAMTPLPRTFPSMCAMLTGRRPHRSGAFMNLLPRDLIDDRESLPRVLARSGYHTTYVTDETRFANIDASFGFAQTITPPIGASDFLISKLADTPVTNLLMNTQLASWLFPHVYANRGAAVTYDPDSFVARIDRELDVRQPLFLNVHLTLGHWPYRWAGAGIIDWNKGDRWPQYYLDVSRRVDQQFADVLNLLEERRLLENAIVVVYSDHGESFGAPHEALVPDGDPLIAELELKPSWGHGTSVLTAHQYRIVLGMRRFGGQWPAGESAAPVSFEDIAPTIVEALGTTTSARFDGRSLLPLLEAREGAEKSFLGRIRYTETEFNPEGLAAQDGQVSTSAMQKAMSVYRIDRVTDRLSVKPAYLGKLLAGRQFAAVGEKYIVGSFPRKHGAGSDFLAVPVAGGEPRRLLAEPEADEPELRGLWIALHTEFSELISRQSVADRERTVPHSVTK
jgi:hypothetical protein